MCANVRNDCSNQQREGREGKAKAHQKLQREGREVTKEEPNWIEKLQTVEALPT